MTDRAYPGALSPDFSSKGSPMNLLTHYKKLATTALLSSCLLFSSVSLADSLSVGGDLIRKMSTAMQTLNYKGSFIYAHDGELESMQILHSASNGVERERLISLNGEAKEIVRDEDSVVDVSPNKETVAVSRSTPRTPFPEFEPEQVAQLEKVYAFKYEGKDRVAGRQVEVINIKPLDNYRYGYRLSIDSETFLLLRSIMKDNNGSIVEQVMFTEVEYLDSIPANTFLTSLEGERQTWKKKTQPASTPEDANMDIPGIDQLSVPLGFEVMSDKVMMLRKNFIARRVMYTDGLASLSVYVSPTGEDADNELQGLMGMGAVRAYGVMHNNWHVTVVGEVPKSTVMMIGDSMKLAEQ